MAGAGRRVAEKGVSPMDALYIHYSPPRVVEARRWARGGDVERLQQAALGGHGHRLLGLGAAGPRARTFLKTLPDLMQKCSALHLAVEDGHLQELQSILEGDPMRRRLAMCRDRAGVGLLHKAVFYDHLDIATYLLDNHPQTVHMRDSEGRTAMHYATACSEPGPMSARLSAAGAERAPFDLRQKTPAYYLARPGTLRLPEPPPPTPQAAEMVIKPANIRIWCHDRDLGRLQQVVWRGQGARLRTEVSSQPAVKRFLEAVPHIMGTIKEIHSSVIQNDTDKLKSLTADPIPPIILSSQDINGLTPLHKAVGLGDVEAVQHILSRRPEAVRAVDADGRTPLHWAVLPKDDFRIYNMLIKHGAEEGKLDNKLKSAGFYKNRPTDIDKSLLTVIPEAPRVATATYPSSWDWELLKTEAGGSALPIPKPKKIVEAIAPVAKSLIPRSISKHSLKDTPKILSPITDTHEMLTDNTLDDDVTRLDSDAESEKDLLPENEDEEFGDPFEKSHNDDVDEHEDKKSHEDISNSPDLNMNVRNELKSSKTPTSGRRTGNRSHNEVTHHIPFNVSPKHETHHEKAPSPAFEHDEKLDNGNESQETQETEEETRDDKPGRPEVQDTDDEKGDDPDLEHDDGRRTGARSEMETNDHDDEDVHVRGESPSEYGDVHKIDTADVLDVEHFKKRRSTKGRVSRGSESTIEGVVNADPEVDSLDAEQKENLVDLRNEDDASIEDEEIHGLIESGNMEQLAALVLNGEGERLVGQMSRNPELQAFLDNVPSYMNKIKRVHLAAREGGLRELQAALDRRKFAIARDRVSPGGATPLHVAALFGHTPVLRYLGGRFPETLSAVDFEGRTALHYAATLKDNGHYYNILQNMGANLKDQDDNGHTPEEYLDNDKYLTHKQLLKDFGAEESLADEMLNDKEATSNNGQVDIPIFRTEEGRYLASSLGDPLIKGLTEVAHARPKDPIAFLATYLYNFANQNKSRLKTQESAALINSENVPEEVDRGRTAPRPGPAPGLPQMALGALGGLASLAPPQTLPPTPQAPVTPGAPEAAFSSDNRDEHGQSMLHFAAARAHARGALLQLAREAGVSPAFRDELYRTARDVSLQAALPDNTRELDRWLIETAARGETEKIAELALEGYDHILDVVDDEGQTLTSVVEQRGQTEMAALLGSIPDFEEARERLHHAIREGDDTVVRRALAEPGGVGLTPGARAKLQSGRALAAAKNAFGRCSLHVAVLSQHEEIVEYIARTFPETLRIGDNLERTALHYAMGVDNVESTSRILIKAGAKRVLKDLKGRQASYYFMNKSDILRLKEEEESY